MLYRSGDRRLFGVAAPLSALRTESGWRVGEFPDLVAFARLCRDIGAGLVQVLPLNDSGGQSSPYSALSAFALHPLYLRVSELPEAAYAPAAVDGLARFASEALPGERFPYEDCLAAKLSALRAVYTAAEGRIASDARLAAFIEERAWVRPYAVYKRLKAAHGERSWKDWPAHRDPAPEDLARLWSEPQARSEHYFYAWVQYRAAEQFEAAAKAVAAMGLELLGDLPILLNEDSADVWADRAYFDASMKAGAPPDMYSEAGQNWGFPLYDWEAMAGDGHGFWRARIAEADRYYSAYRIDHVLGFFRIWALGEREESGRLGRYEPGPLLTADELKTAGFSAERLRWLSEPHVPGAELRASAPDAAAAERLALERIGDEDLFLFAKSIGGEADLTALCLDAGSTAFLKERWRDRALLAVGAGLYAPTWTLRESRAWLSLSDAERAALGALVEARAAEAERGWALRGRELLSMLKSASGMLPCAEDLGAVPDCVPRVLAELGIPGLRVPRWMRRWKEPGQPYIRLADYDEPSVCTPSVHDTSTLRAWWDHEEGRKDFAAAYAPSLAPVPERLGAEDERVVLAALAACPSRLFVVQLQDLLDLSDDHRSADPRADRINVPGTLDGFNWTWRMPASAERLSADETWTAIVKASTRR